MTAQMIDGRALAAGIRERVRLQIAELPRAPRLLSVYVGDDIASAVYIRNQRRACEQVGIRFELEHQPADITEERLIQRLLQLGEDPTVTGVLLQRPLPAHLHPMRLQAKIHPDKDVEGLNPANIGSIVYGNPKLVPCTALAALRCYLSTGRPLKGADVVMVGHSEIVGKPIAFMMLNYFATATICHVATQNLATKTRAADVVFTAVGKPGLIHGSMLRRGAVVIDIGISQVPLLGADGQPLLDENGGPRYRLAGDVDFESARGIASHLTPVPGGVGPVTVAMLLHNTVIAARLQCGMPLLPAFDSSMA